MAAESRISDEAVQTRTGKDWSQWFRLLDRWSASKKGHQATARWLHVEHELSPWWSQTIAVRYEQERGLRQKHERAKGFEISVSRRVESSATRIFDALIRPADLSKWFTRGARADAKIGGAYSNRDGDRGRFLAIARPRRIRMTWENEAHAPGTVVEFAIAKSVGGKSQVEVTHAGLASRKDAETMKEAWSWALDSLRSYLETGKPIAVEAWEAARDAKTKAKAKPIRAKARKRIRASA